MDDLSDFYCQYGESLAARLATIAHSATRPGFVMVEDLGDPAELLSFTTNKKGVQEGQNVLVWEHFQEDIDTGGRDNYHTVIRGSVSIIRKSTDRTQIRSTYAQTRQIALKLLALMLQDEQEGQLEEKGIRVNVRNLPTDKVGPVSVSWYGYGLQFSWTVPLDLDLSPGDLVA